MAHDLPGGEVDEIDLEDLGHEGEAPGGPEVALDDLHLVVLGNELDVEGTGDVEGAGDPL